MTSILDSMEIEVPCGGCNKKIKKSIGWLKINSQFTCNCSTINKLESSQFKGEIAKAEKSLAELQNTLKKFGK